MIQRRRKEDVPKAVHHLSEFEKIRVWKMISIILTGICFTQALTINALFPLKTQETRYVEFVNSDDIRFKYIPSPEINIDSKKAILRREMRNFVINRNTIDHIGDKSRVKILDEYLHKDLRPRVGFELEKLWKAYEDNTRKVEIILDDFDIKQDGVHKVVYRVIDGVSGEQMELEEQIEYHIDNTREVVGDHVQNNFLNIVITNYSVSKRNK